MNQLFIEHVLVFTVEPNKYSFFIKFLKSKFENTSIIKYGESFDELSIYNSNNILKTIYILFVDILIVEEIITEFDDTIFNESNCCDQRF